MGVLRMNAVAFSAFFIAIAVGLSGLSDSSRAGCLGYNKLQKKYGCDEETGGSQGFSLFGSSKDDEPEQPETSSPEAEPASVTADDVDFISYPPLIGPKRTIAVLTFENKAKGVFGAQEVGEGLTEMAITELIESDYFIVVERGALAEILKEQELGMSGLVQQDAAARVGALAGAQLLIKGVVSEFAYQAQGGGLNVAFSGLDLGMKTKSAHVGLDIRMIDPSTAEIIDSLSVSAKASATGFNIGYAKTSKDLRIGTGFFEKTPLGQAARLAIQRAVFSIIENSDAVPWSGTIIKADNSSAYVNRGLNSNLGVGDKLTIFSKGEDLIDPETGLNLGADEMPIGTLDLTTVKEKYSIGKYRLFETQALIKRGDIVRFSAESLQN